MYAPQQYVEIFHLLFLRHLEGKLEKNLYALKGGANLRFFFKSIRYSEDIDFDVKIIAKDTLRPKITKLLNSQPFKQTLYSKGIEIIKINESKQTDTTQRWKLNLQTPNASLPLPTKIEFSRRTMTEKTIFESVDVDIIQTYQLYPILTNHYSAETAFYQKIYALISRTETQARDIFDLKWLLDLNIKIKSLPASIKIDFAIEQIKGVGFPEFKSQVVAYLMTEYQEYYSIPKRWNEIQTQVITTLQTLKK
ncbi:MAG: hypothetical protein A2Z91_00680 [Deltaproteobacteria bacterium GWA2_38_16]|nr:MAG: hypothetical protein A2Z91_00680 [Deltaproteobacteria bacterium GWA2_38_16]OGQ03615.1 MAG: hypothetical protein A3D19_02085 [Deltaproteobacteria bacterium RIFCSPHIGHO2_02_FULL_38_15]OGQ35029.1 MAG: hypothetical protein A3A72_07940 [Deltaproteobacteria bacterium RIFCSPLOWO2_01_FULL_38_9]OGQ59885.1 MAG: hypothetical protein A3G92_05675 [Deltaproteobacteria bacterium RIFCSPLOWO2_12_FULL_38_8]HBQ21140.1 hypothetical protein [Deltaproteobacteria bacterium]